MRALHGFSTKIRSLILEPHESNLSEADRHQARLLTGLVLILLVTGFLNEIFFTLDQYRYGYRGFIYLLAFIPILAIAYHYSRTIHFRKAAFALSIISSLAASAFFYFSQNTGTPYILTYLIIPILFAGYFLPYWQLLLVLVSDVILLVAFTFRYPELEGDLLVAILPEILIAGFLVMALTRNRDLVERERTKALLAQEARFRMLLEQTFESICIHVNGRIQETNAGFLKMFGYSADESKKLRIADLFVPSAEGGPAYQLPLQTEHMVEQPVRRKDGEILYVEVIRYGDPDSPTGGQAFAFRDVTLRRHAEEAIRKEVEERRQTEAALRESQEALSQALDGKEQLLSAITSLLIGVDSAGMVTHWNEPAARSFEIKPSDAIGRPFAELPIQWDWPYIHEELRLCRETGRRRKLAEFTLPLPDGKRRVLGMTLTPMRETHLENTGVLFLGSDITEQVILQQQLEQRNKLESIGQLSAGIAHEINTPAQFIGGNLRFLKDHFPGIQSILARAADGGRVADVSNPSSAPSQKERRQLEYLIEEYPKAIDQSLDGIGRISSIVSALRDFSHPGSARRSLVNINKGLDSTIAVARNEWKYVADVETQFDPDLPMVECYPGELNQVFLNILINAVHAIRDVVGDGETQKGKIRVETRSGGDWVEVRISDSGTGIPPAIQDRIFDPFFTTKDIGKGSGQGLAITHTIVVQKHAGSIRFETGPGSGTTFIIRLPIHPPGQMDSPQA